MTSMIDRHGHYTTAPPQHDAWREAQKAAFKAGEAPPPYPIGAVRGIDPRTGQYFDDTKRYVDALPIDETRKHAIFEGNGRRVFPRLDAMLKDRGL
jgi:hypothetical protein